MAEDVHQGPLELGENFLKYSIKDIVGRGGHAWVYSGRDEFFDRDVAIKILHRPGGVTPDMLRRGRAEAQLLSRLRHPNVVEVVDAGITNEAQLYIVMELLRGKTLREVLRARGKLPVTDALRLFVETTEGVEAAHKLGAIHRDLKPENLFVLDDGTPKVLDFGIAKVVDSAGWSTAKDVINGTILYMSPEQLQGFRATACSDVYALGLMLYEALLGKHPCLLSNPSPTVRELAFIQRVKQPPLLCELDASIPRHVARAVARAMAKIPEKRVQSMTELGAALRTCLERIDTEDGDKHRSGGSSEAAEQHDTVPLPRDLLFDSAPPAHPTGRPGRSVGRVQETPAQFATAAAGTGHELNRTPELAEPSDRTHTAPPVITQTHSALEGRSRALSGARQRALRRVVVAGAIVGTLIGVVLFHLLPRPQGATSREESGAGARTAGRIPSVEPLPNRVLAAAVEGEGAAIPGPAVGPAVPTGAPDLSAPRQEPVTRQPATPVPTALRQPRPTTKSATASQGPSVSTKRSSSAREGAAPSPPEREVWIE